MVTGKYRKIHLYDALGFKESDKMSSGSVIPLPTKTSVGKMGMLICYDLRFPEMSRTLASSGTEILVVPSAWVNGPMKEEHWLTLNKSRAIENGCYVIAPDHLGHVYSGRSLAVDPYGRILLDMKKRQGIGYVNISLDTVHEVRKKLPLLKIDEQTFILILRSSFTFHIGTLSSPILFSCISKNHSWPLTLWTFSF